MNGFVTQEWNHLDELNYILSETTTTPPRAHNATYDGLVDGVRLLLAVQGATEVALARVGPGDEVVVEGALKTAWSIKPVEKGVRLLQRWRVWFFVCSDAWLFA